MKFRAVRENLLYAVETAAKAATNKSLPVLSALKVEAGDGYVTITGTNLETAIEARSPASIGEVGSAVISAKDLIKAVKAAPKGKLVSIEVEGAKVSTNDGQITYRMLGYDVDDFPTVLGFTDDPTATTTTSLDAAQLAVAIEETVMAAAKDEARPILCAINVKLENGRLSMAGADNHRVTSSQLGFGSTTAEELNISIPQQSLALLPALLGRLPDSAPLVLMVEARRQQRVLFDLGDVRLSSRLIDGQYPNYQQVIPSQPGTTITFRLADLVRVMKAIDQNVRFAELRLSEGRLEVKGKYDELEFEAGIDGTYAPVEDCSDEIVVDPKYLRDLAAFGYETATLDIHGLLSPMKFTFAGSETIYVVMPQRIRP